MTSLNPHYILETLDDWIEELDWEDEIAEILIPVRTNIATILINRRNKQ